MIFAMRAVDSRSFPDTWFKAAYERQRPGAQFSYVQLIDRALTLEGKVSEASLKRAADTFEPTMLPPQTGVACPDRHRQALRFAYRHLAPEQSGKVAQAPPAGYVRVLLDSRGPLSGPEQEFVSAYCAARSEGEIAPPRARNEIYFGVRRFGIPDRYFGPFQIDAHGIPIEAPPPRCDGEGDSIKDQALLGRAAQASLRKVHEAKDLFGTELFTYDYDTVQERESYAQLSEEALARLTSTERQVVASCYDYGALGNLAPTVNRELRAHPPRTSPTARVLDSALARSARLPQGLCLFRGIIKDQALKRGSVFVDPGFLFCSLEPSVARMFTENKRGAEGRRILMAIQLAEPVQGLLTGNRGEQEVLLPRNLPLKVVSTFTQQGVQYCQLRTASDAREGDAPRAHSPGK